MPYAFVEDIAASWERYERFAAAFDGPPPDGLLLHAAGPTDEGFRIIGVWESEAAWDRFRSDRLGGTEPVGEAPTTVRVLRPAHVVHGVTESVSGAGGGGGPPPPRPTGRDVSTAADPRPATGRAKEVTMHVNHALRWIAMALAGVAILVAASAAAAAPAATCGICGKNLIKNPSAEAGAGITAVGAYGVVPGWTNTAGQFGAASYTFPNGWFSKLSKGSPKRGKNYFFGGTTTEAVTAKATIGTQTIKLPSKAVGRKVTLGGWIGNYGTGPSANMTQVRADFADASGTVLARLRIGNDTTVAGTDMAFRSRKGMVPAGATQVTIVVTFVGGNNYKLAGADDLSLVLA